MTLLLDTSILIGVQKKDKAVAQKINELKKIHFMPACISFISYFEFYNGIIKKSAKSRQEFIDYLNEFNCLKASSITADIMAKLKNKYDGRGVVIGVQDLIIASHALESNAVLVTRDKIFEKIEEIEKIII